MIDQTQLDRLYECDMVDANGEKIGSVKQVWVDDNTGRPLWAEVNTGLFGMKDTFVPIQNASIGNGQVMVPMDKRQIKDSPHVNVHGGHMSDEQQEELNRYYGIIPTASTGEHDRLTGDKGKAGRHQTDRRQTEQRQGDRRQDVAGQSMAGQDVAGQGVAGQDVAGQDVAGQSVAGQGIAGQSMAGQGIAGQAPDRRAMDGDRRQGADAERRQGPAGKRRADRADATKGMIRHEEQLSAGTRDVEVGRVRLVKHVVTEEQNITVPVSHEEVRVVREPMDGTAKADSDAFIDAESEMTLHRQEAVVEKTVRPMERIHLEKETVTEQQQVSGKVRKERVDVEDDTGRKR